MILKHFQITTNTPAQFTLTAKDNTGDPIKLRWDSVADSWLVTTPGDPVFLNVGVAAEMAQIVAQTPTKGAWSL